MEFLNFEIDEKKYIKLLVILLVALVVFLAFLFSSLLVFTSYKLGPNTSVNDEAINTHIDILEHDKKKLEIAGWAYKEGEAIGIVNCNYVIKNQKTGKMYLMRTQMEENGNIKEEEHKMAGIHAQCLIFGIPKGWYDIYVLYRNDSEDILANTLISVEL